MEQQITSADTGFGSSSTRRGDLVILIGLAAITIVSMITAVSGSRKRKKNRNSKMFAELGSKRPVFVEQAQPVK